jgi:hypothetical protein
MMRKYKENEVSRDIFYEEEKRDKMKKAMEDKMAADKNNKEIQENLEDEDPWLKSKFSEATIVEEANEDVTTAEDVTTTTDSGTTDPSVKEV